MSYYKVSIDGLSKAETIISAQKMNLKAIVGSALSVKKALTKCELGQVSTTLLRRMDAAIGSLEKQEQICVAMASALSTIRKQYVETENRASQRLAPVASKSEKKERRAAENVEINAGEGKEKSLLKGLLSAAGRTVESAAGVIKNVFSFTKNVASGDFVGAASDGWDMINAPFKIGQSLVAITMYGIGGISELINGDGNKFSQGCYAFGDEYLERDGLKSELSGTGLEKPVEILNAANDAYDAGKSIKETGDNISDVGKAMKSEYLSNDTKAGIFKHAFIEFIGLKDSTGVSGITLQEHAMANIEKSTALMDGFLYGEVQLSTPIHKIDKAISGTKRLISDLQRIIFY